LREVRERNQGIAESTQEKKGTLGAGRMRREIVEGKESLRTYPEIPVMNFDKEHASFSALQMSTGSLYPRCDTERNTQMEHAS
jgi:hypothetical protein